MPPVIRPPFEELSIEQLRRHQSAKWTYYGPDVLPLWVAEMDVRPAPEVIEALSRAIRDGDTGYPGAGPRYAEAFAPFADARWGWQVHPSASAVCADVMSGIRVLLQRVVGAGGLVVVPSPAYPPLAGFAAELGTRVVQVPLTPEGRLELGAIADALAADVPATQRAVLLCSPQNPTGTVHTAAELSDLADLAARLGATVIADEVHAPLVPDGATFVPYLTVADAGFSVVSAAKAFNLAGLKAGLIVAGMESRGDLRDLPESVAYGASHLGVIGHSAAFRSDPAWLDAVNENIRANREHLGARLAADLPEVGYREPEATYLAWLDLAATGLGDDPAARLLTRARVALTAGPPFGPGGPGHARLNLACSRALLDEAIDRIVAAIRLGPA